MHDLFQRRGRPREWVVFMYQPIASVYALHTTCDRSRLILFRQIFNDDQARCQPFFFLVSPRDHFVRPVPPFSEMKEIGSKKVQGFQLPGLQVATRLTIF